ncbi:MAG: hypothetical protein ACFFKA_01380 [Candidatus Thorarchaeota archaeon]
MSDTSLFDLEKIKKLMEPIELLEEKLNSLKQLESNLANFDKKYIMNISDNELLFEKVNSIMKMIESINQTFEIIFKENLNIFIYLQDNLFEKYKAKLKDLIIKSEIDPLLLKKIGLYLIEGKKGYKFLNKISIVKSIEINEWIELLDVLKENSIFHIIIEKLRIYYNEFINLQLDKELKNLPLNVNNNLIEKFKAAFLENPDLKFTEFIKSIDDAEKSSRHIISESLIKERKEKEKLEELKKKQEERKDEYQEYLTLSEKEFERKLRKKKRTKLSEISKTKKPGVDLVISDEVSEKIEKFKSQFNESFKDKFLINEESDKDPIDLIRKRTKKKKEEYAKYKDHFDNL